MTSIERQKAYENFAGFLDGYRASNLARLETSLDGVLLEMSARFKMLEDSGQRSGPASVSVFSGLAQKLVDRQFDIVERLAQVGNRLLEIISTNALRSSAGDPIILTHLRRVLYLFVTAAEMSNSARLVTLAVQLGDSFRASIAPSQLVGDPT